MTKEIKQLRWDIPLSVSKSVGENEPVESIYIEGMASTSGVDRAGDVVPGDVWKKGMANFLKNPIILAHHDRTKPIGRCVEHKASKDGLWIKAKISPAAPDDIYELIKDGVITAFSVCFRVLDATYDSVTELFVVKELELMEISVVSIPCNQDTLFSLSKNFDNTTEYLSYKQQFASSSDSAKGLESGNDVSRTSKKELIMDPKELQAALDAAANTAAEKAAQAVIAAQKAEAAEAARKQAEEDALKKQIAEAVAGFKSETGSDKLLADIEKKLADQNSTIAEAIKTFGEQIKEKTDELKAASSSKMEFKDTKGGSGDVAYAEKEKAIMLSKILRKDVAGTKFGKELLEKAGPHVASATWELEVSLRMEEEVRRRLVVAPLFRTIEMKTNVMTIPVNPEAGTATWVTNAQFGSTASMGGTQTHQLKEITLNAYKVATNEYMNYEEEEDSLLVLMPVVRDAMIRRTARALDKAFLLGAGAGADPVKGLATYYATSAGSLFPSLSTGVTNQVSSSTLRAMRKALGALGLDPADVVFVVSTDCYYSLLEDTNFMTVDKFGDRATLLTGQIGSVANSPVLVSAEFPATAAGTATGSANIGAIAVYLPNFLVGNQRGLRFDTQDLVETQRKVLVASLRTGMTQIATNLGQGVATLRWNT